VKFRRRRRGTPLANMRAAPRRIARIFG
jgi:hypothetical protein